MSKSESGASNAVQTTFTKQKRELAKASAIVNQIRAQERRVQRFTPDGRLETEERESYLLAPPQELARKVIAIVEEVVCQHGARQRANGTNTGKFEFRDISIDLTVPQLRALQEASATLRNLVEKLPVENKRLIPNIEIDGRPAFAAPMEQVKETKKRIVPYEEKESTRVRTYVEEYEEVVYQTRQITIDYGLPAAAIQELNEAVGDLETAIQVAIDEANAKPHEGDPALRDTVAKIASVFNAVIGG